MRDVATSVVVIDHHKTAENALDGLPDCDSLPGEEHGLHFPADEQDGTLPGVGGHDGVEVHHAPPGVVQVRGAGAGVASSPNKSPCSSLCKSSSGK